MDKNKTTDKSKDDEHEYVHSDLDISYILIDQEQRERSVLALERIASALEWRNNNP